MDAKLLVVGGNSRVGQLLRQPLRDAPVTWCARDGADVQWRLEDGASALAPMLDGQDAVLCLAGATPGAGKFDLNTDVALAVIEAARQAGCPRVLLCSSMAVYGPGFGHAEDGPCAPAAPYGASKLEMEQRAAAAAGDVAVTALRLGNVAGADALFRNIAAGRAITLDLFDDGTTPARSYIDPTLLARVLMALLRLPDLPPVLNLAADPPVEMAALMRAAGADYATRPAPDTALREVSMDLSRLKTLVDLPDRPAEAILAGLAKAEAPDDSG